MKSARGPLPARFTQYMAAMIAISESVPEEINNQIRNAFTHVARAAHAETLTDVNAEVEKAIGHIERACRDCLKVSIIYARENLDQLVADVVFFYGFMPPDTKAKLATLKSLRREANVAEHVATRGKSRSLRRSFGLFSMRPTTSPPVTIAPVRPISAFSGR
jgi:hypothetical protein